MKNIFAVSLFILLSLATATYADTDDMMGGYGMMDGWGMAGFGFIGLFYLIIVFFIFSAVFWLTYRWIVGDEKQIIDEKKVKVKTK